MATVTESPAVGEIDQPMNNKRAARSTRALASSLKSLSSYDVEVRLGRGADFPTSGSSWRLRQNPDGGGGTSAHGHAGEAKEAKLFYCILSVSAMWLDC